jgi:hypothetical protein
VDGESRQYNLDIPGTTPKQPISISIPNKNHENAFFLAIVDTLNTTPYLTEFNKETKLVNITHMKCRYAIQEKTKRVSATVVSEPTPNSIAGMSEGLADGGTGHKQ